MLDKQYTITLESSHGTLVANTAGIVEDGSEFFPDFPSHTPARLDVEEWKKRYPGEEPTGHTWDILDWGYWTTSGKYEPAQNRSGQVA